jgi:hypothetical protein
MNKRRNKFRRELIANAQQYDPIVRDTLLQPDVLDSCVQYLAKLFWTPKLSIRHKPGYKPDHKFKPRKGPAPIPASRIIEEESALLGFSKAYTIKSYGNEDEITFLNRCKPAVIRFFKRNLNVKARLIIYCEMENIIVTTGANDSKEVEFRSGSELILRSTNLSGMYGMAKSE